MKPLPTRYHIEVYEDSFINDPSWSVESTTPFPAIATGERFNHLSLDTGWYNPPNNYQEFRVRDIEHIFWVIENSHIGHKLMVALELVTPAE